MLRRSMVTPKSRKWARKDEKAAEEERMLNRYKAKASKDEGPRQEPGTLQGIQSCTAN